MCVDGHQIIINMIAKLLIEFVQIQIFVLAKQNTGSINISSQINYHLNYYLDLLFRLRNVK